MLGLPESADDDHPSFRIWPGIGDHDKMPVMKTRISTRLLSIIFLHALLVPALFAETTMALPGNRGFATVKEIMMRSCSTCHDWTGSRETIIADGRVVPGDPDASILYRKIADDSMPASGDKLTADEKAFIKGWIKAGATDTELPLAVDAGRETAPSPPPSSRFLFFPSKVVFHEVTGFTSAVLFTAAGVLGVIHYLDMKNTIHPNGVTEGEGTGGEGDFGQMSQIWNSQQALRWWHVGFLIGGETLYLGDALTGISMMTSRSPGKLKKSDIHRFAFFTHASLMAAQVVLGFLETDALANGRHDAAIYYTGAHALIGVAIPAVMIYAGLENILP
jgi:hypothetical protein